MSIIAIFLVKTYQLSTINQFELDNNDLKDQIQDLCDYIKGSTQSEECDILEQFYEMIKQLNQKDQNKAILFIKMYFQNKSLLPIKVLRINQEFIECSQKYTMLMQQKEDLLLVLYVLQQLEILLVKYNKSNYFIKFKYFRKIDRIGFQSLRIKLINFNLQLWLSLSGMRLNVKQIFEADGMGAQYQNHLIKIFNRHKKDFLKQQKNSTKLQMQNSLYLNVTMRKKLKESFLLFKLIISFYQNKRLIFLNVKIRNLRIVQDILSKDTTFFESFKKNFINIFKQEMFKFDQENLQNKNQDKSCQSDKKINSWQKIYFSIYDLIKSEMKKLITKRVGIVIMRIFPNLIIV